MNNTKLLVLDTKTNILRKFTGPQFICASVLHNDADMTLELWLAEIEQYRKD